MRVTQCEIIQADFGDTLRNVAAMGGADLIVTSPPYADARTYGADVKWTMADYQRLGDAVKPALKPGGHCLMVLDAPVREWRDGYGTERGFLPWLVMLDWAERVGMRVPDRLAYGRFGQPGEYRGRFRNDWEPLLWFQRPGGEGFFDKWAIAGAAEYGKRPGAPVTARGSDGHRRPDVYSGRAASENKKHRGTFWGYGSVGAARDIDGENTDHPARFTLAFAADAVRCFAPPGGLVVDPFVGSGTSAAAAAMHGRRFYGGDLLCRPDGKPWAEVATERVHSATRQRRL